MTNIITKDEYIVSFIDYMALAEATYSGNGQLVKLLMMEDKINPMNGNPCEIFLLPARFGYFEVLKHLIDNKHTNLSAIITVEWDIGEQQTMKLCDAIRLRLEDKYHGRDITEFLEYFNKK